MQQITNGDYQDWNPDWSIYGIVFASNRDDSQGVWVVQPNGEGLEPMNTSFSGIMTPRWMADGGIIVSRSDPEDPLATAQIWTSSSDSSIITKITELNGFSSKGDVNMDGILDRMDYLSIRSALGYCEGDDRFFDSADLNMDGCVSYADYRIWLGYYRSQ
jgi:hypothetical protein